MPVALLARVTDTHANQSFERTFERFPVRLGRNQLNDLAIDRPFISQFHAAIEVRDHRQIFIKDLGSTNGVTVAGQRLAKDALVDITGTPEFKIGPVVVQLKLIEPAARVDRPLGVLDAGPAPSASPQAAQNAPPGPEDAYVRQLLPYIDAYRKAWGGVYQVIYGHLQHLPPTYHTAYVRRLSQDQPAIALEADFQKIAKHYGVEARALAEMGPPQAAYAAMNELARSLAPGFQGVEDVQGLLGFARRLRDAMEVFMKCFVSLRDGYREFETGVLARERQPNERVQTARDEKELGLALLDPSGSPDASRQLHDIFVDVMSHQLALMSGVMEGVKTLMNKLSPRALEEELERSGKKGGLFSNRYEALWKLYETRHADYAEESAELQKIIFGPNFSRAYAASAGEDQTQSGSGGASALSRFTLQANQIKR